MTQVSNRLKRGARLSAVLAAFALVLVTAGVATAGDAEWPSSSNAIGYTDDWDFNYTSTESNTGDYWEYVTYMDYAMFAVWGGLTDLKARSKHRTYYSWIDIGWYMTTDMQDNVAGDTRCRVWKNKSANICDRSRVRFAEFMLNRVGPSHTTTQKRNVACHEVGHVVGFGHGTAGTSCMDNGNTGTITDYERNLVNARY